MKSAYIVVLTICALLMAVFPASASISASPAGSHSIVITQLYVPGGSTNAPYTTVYIELFNAGPVPIDLTDFTLQYQSATGSMGPTNSYLLGPNSSYTTGGIVYPASATFTYNNGFNGILQPGQYLLIQPPSQGAVGTALPLTPDIVLAKSLNGTTAGKPSTSGGKYAVVHSFSGIYCGSNSTNPARTNSTTDPYHVLIGPMATDFIGYRSDTGSTPNCYEGNGPIYIKPDTTISSSKNNVAAVRAFVNGCPVDTNNNGNMDASTTPPTFSTGDFAMIKIGPGMTNGWQLHNSASVMTNGDAASIQSYTPTMCAQNANTVTPVVNAIASVATDATLTPVTKIEAGVDTPLVLTATVTDGGSNPTSAFGYLMTTDLTGLGASLVESSLATAVQKFGFLAMDPSFGNPQYQFPVPPENPAPTTPPTPVTFTVHPDVADKGKTLTIPVSITDDAQRKITANIDLQVVGSTPGAASVSVVPASVPATIATAIDLTATITDAGLYPKATSFTVTMDLTSIGGGNAVPCPEVSTDVFTCHTTMTADAAKVGGSYTIPVTVVDDLSRTLTLSPTAIQIGVTAAPEPIANLVWATSSTGSFGNVTEGTISSAQTATLTNTGLADLSITGVAISGDFKVSNNCPASLSAGASCSMSVTFTPTSVGALAGTLTVTDNSHLVAGSQQTLALTGTGTPPPATAELSKTALIFGNQIVTTASAAQSATLTNNGGMALAIAGIGISGANSTEFQYTTTCKASLAAGASCDFTVTFKPTTAGSKAATLTINDDAAGNPHTITFSGAGIDFPVGAAEGSPTTATVKAGDTATFALQISPAGPFTGSVTLACTTVIQAATCTVNPSNVNITGPGAIPLTLSVKTSARSTQTAQVSGLTAFMGSQGGPGSKGPGGPIVALCLTTLIAGALFASSKSVRRQWRSAAVCAALLCAMGMTGCAGLKTNPWPAQPAIGTPSGTYQLNVTATSGTVVRTTTLTLTVN